MTTCDNRGGGGGNHGKSFRNMWMWMTPNKKSSNPSKKLNNKKNTKFGNCVKLKASSNIKNKFKYLDKHI